MPRMTGSTSQTTQPARSSHGASAREALLDEVVAQHMAHKPRSPEYRDGFTAAIALNFKLLGKLVNPHEPQTAQHDAWSAGCGAGHDAVDRGANMYRLAGRCAEIERAMDSARFDQRSAV